MYCSKCGKELAKGARFCSNCGTGTDSLASSRKNAGVKCEWIQNKVGIPVIESENIKVKNAREYISLISVSLLFLIALICYTLATLFKLKTVNSASDIFTAIANTFGLDSLLSESFFSMTNQVFAGMSLLGTVIKSMPAITACIGLWFIFAQGKDRFRKGYIGFKILQILEGILIGVTVALVLIVAVILLTMGNEIGFDWVGEAVGIAMILYLVIMGLIINYHRLVMKTMKIMMISIRENRPCLPISRYVIGGTFIIAFGTFIGNLTSNHLFLGLMETAAYVIFAFLMIQLNKDMQTLGREGSVDYISKTIKMGSKQNDVWKPETEFGTQSGPVTADRQMPIVSQKVKEENFRDDTLSEDIQEIFWPGENTMLLGKSNLTDVNVPKACLQSEETGETIEIKKDSFSIGKDPKNNDYIISNDPTISRIHAEIVRRDRTYYVKDLESTNHTYLNGIIIPGGKEIKLDSEDKITFARKTFIFRYGV